MQGAGRWMMRAGDDCKRRCVCNARFVVAIAALATGLRLCCRMVCGCMFFYFLFLCSVPTCKTSTLFPEFYRPPTRPSVPAAHFADLNPCRFHHTARHVCPSIVASVFSIAFMSPAHALLEFHSANQFSRRVLGTESALLTSVHTLTPFNYSAQRCARFNSTAASSICIIHACHTFHNMIQHPPLPHRRGFHFSRHYHRKSVRHGRSRGSPPKFTLLAPCAALYLKQAQNLSTKSSPKHSKLSVSCILRHLRLFRQCQSPFSMHRCARHSGMCILLIPISAGSSCSLLLRSALPCPSRFLTLPRTPATAPQSTYPPSSRT